MRRLKRIWANHHHEEHDFQKLGVSSTDHRTSCYTAEENEKWPTLNLCNRLQNKTWTTRNKNTVPINTSTTGHTCRQSSSDTRTLQRWGTKQAFESSTPATWIPPEPSEANLPATTLANNQSTEPREPSKAQQITGTLVSPVHRAGRCASSDAWPRPPMDIFGRCNGGAGLGVSVPLAAAAASSTTTRSANLPGGSHGPGASGASGSGPSRPSGSQAGGGGGVPAQQQTTEAAAAAAASQSRMQLTGAAAPGTAASPESGVSPLADAYSKMTSDIFAEKTLVDYMSEHPGELVRTGELSGCVRCTARGGRVLLVKREVSVGSNVLGMWFTTIMVNGYFEDFWSNFIRIGYGLFEIAITELVMWIGY